MSISSSLARWVGVCLLAVGAMTSCTEVSEQEDQPRERPNFVIVLVDDMRWDDFGAAGHPFAETPHIDRVATAGARFMNSFTTTPLCSPSRASFLTGLYAHSHGIIDNTSRGPMSHQLDTFPRRLHDAGYETAFVGKWHMGSDDSARPGFDYWVSMRGQGRNIDPEIIENQDRAEVKGHVTEIFTDRAIGFIERERTSPFLLYLAHKALHPGRGGLSSGGFAAAERHEGRYADAELSRRPNYGVPPRDKPALLRQILDLPPLGPETVTPDQTIRDRSEMLLGVDDSLGRILSTLEQKGLLDNTVVVVTSDHGYFYGEHCLDVERRFAYEETARIPMVIQYPPLITGGSTPEQLVLSIDLAPTVLSLAGLPTEGLQGRSLVPLLSNQPVEWRSSFLIEHHTDPDEYLGRMIPRASGMGYNAVRTERYKYIEFTDLEGMDELYDLETDPYEMNNLIAEDSAEEILAKMKEELSRLLSETS